MSVPKKRRTKSEKLKRQFQQKLKLPHLIFCSKCRKPILPFRVCPFCGTYQGKEVIKLKTKKKKGKKKEK